MTLITFASIKGSPGATTLACLTGATWPAGRRVIVAECDSDGGDLAFRFSLSTKIGWQSLAAAARRSDVGGSVGAHLQSLPGGLEVLVAPTRGVVVSNGSRAAEDARGALCGIAQGSESDVIVDLGRLHLESVESQRWLAQSETVCIVLRADAAAIAHVQEQVGTIQKRCGGTLLLILIGNGPYSVSEIERFTGVPVIIQVPHDQAAAAVLTLGRGSQRRLARSALVRSARRLGRELASAGHDGPSGDEETDSEITMKSAGLEGAPDGENGRPSEQKTRAQAGRRSPTLQDQK
jgi:Flp pilus assembly CpaE family ATPase